MFGKSEQDKKIEIVNLEHDNRMEELRFMRATEIEILERQQVIQEGAKYFPAAKDPREEPETMAAKSARKYGKRRT